MKYSVNSRLVTIALILGSAVGFESALQLHSADAAATRSSIIPRKALVLERGGEGQGRRFRFRGPDPLEPLLIRGELANFHPVEGQVTAGPRGGTWTSVDLDENGGVRSRGGYLFVPVQSGSDKVMILKAIGQGAAFVNGLPRTGNVYGYDYVHLPVRFHEGDNRILMKNGRGRFGVSFYEPPAPVFIHKGDATIPDLIMNEAFETWCGLIVINATEDWQHDFVVRTRGVGFQSTDTEVPSLPPLSIRKVGVEIRGSAPSSKGNVNVDVSIHNRIGEVVHGVEFALSAVGPHDSRKQTFISQIDGSVQYFAMRPAIPLSEDDPAPAILLSCHGVSVEARGQSAAYSPKSWLHLVAPTNRRPYGFDWEDLGRTDAMEVLAIAKNTLDHDPSPIYLTGHSMGGHGAWHLGVTYPDQFAAIGPSAGWISRSSYGRRGNEATLSDIERFLKRERKSVKRSIWRPT